MPPSAWPATQTAARWPKGVYVHPDNSQLKVAAEHLESGLFG
ncbi:hypothetical protein [Micromonospora chalcea]